MLFKGNITYHICRVFEYLNYTINEVYLTRICTGYNDRTNFNVNLMYELVYNIIQG